MNQEKSTKIVDIVTDARNGDEKAIKFVKEVNRYLEIAVEEMAKEADGFEDEIDAMNELNACLTMEDEGQFICSIYQYFK